MKKEKIKIYRLPLSRVFPATHPRAGEPTEFRYLIEVALKNAPLRDLPFSCNYYGKIHTIRAINPESKSKNWTEKIKDVQEGKAVLVVYQWNGKPYSADGCTNRFVFGTDKTEVFIDGLMRTGKYEDAIPVIDSGIGTQKLTFCYGAINRTEVTTYGYMRDVQKSINILDLAKNDGLSVEDFRAWFRNYDLSKPLVIIHFTKFRY
jgi:hypothetical protein